MAEEREMQQPTVWYEGHLHPLTVLEDIPSHNPPCHECGRPCDSPPVLPVFHCTRCGFNLHLLCGPLPTKIQPPQFLDMPLILADSYAENDGGEYYCDFCPERRDPRDCVYHSEDHYYVVHVTCVISEVLCSLKGETGDVVELRTLGKLIPGRAVSKGSNSDHPDEGPKETAESRPTLKEIYVSLTKNENELKEFKNLSIPGDISSDFPAWFPYSRDAFIQLLKRLDAATLPWEELIKSYNLDAEVVYVGEHQITRDFANILEKLTRKLGEFIPGPSSLSPRVKTFVLVLLCDVVYSMYRTKIEDVTERMLMTWWARLKVVRRANFRVRRVEKHLTRVVGAYFGSEAKKFAEGTMADLDTKIDELSKQLEQLRAAREKHRTLVKSTRPIIEQFLDEASALSWKTVGADLLP